MRSEARSRAPGSLAAPPDLAPVPERDPAPPPRISAAGRRRLLDLARSSVVAAVTRSPSPVVDRAVLGDELWIPGAAFVTLTEDGALRGCMGRLDPEATAWGNVAAAAAMAAVRDPRFRPVAPDELPFIRLEVSVLSPSVAISDPAEFVPGRHGIVVERGPRRALFLPQVAPEQGWGREETLAAVCLKAGLGQDAWRDAGTRLEVFTATVFGEDEDDTGGEGEGEGGLEGDADRDGEAGPEGDVDRDGRVGADGTGALDPGIRARDASARGRGIVR